MIVQITKDDITKFQPAVHSIFEDIGLKLDMLGYIPTYNYCVEILTVCPELLMDDLKLAAVHFHEGWMSHLKHTLLDDHGNFGVDINEFMKNKDISKINPLVVAYHDKMGFNIKNGDYILDKPSLKNLIKPSTSSKKLPKIKSMMVNRTASIV